MVWKLTGQKLRVLIPCINYCREVCEPGFYLIEKRLVDVVLRYGFSKYTIEKWKSTFEIQRYFEERIGMSIYNILPNVVKNTFGFQNNKDK